LGIQGIQGIQESGMKDWAWLPRFIPDFLDSLDSLNSCTNPEDIAEWRK